MAVAAAGRLLSPTLASLRDRLLAVRSMDDAEVDLLAYTWACPPPR